MFPVPLHHLGNILRWKKSFLAWESLLAYAFLFSKDSADDTGRGLFGNLQHNHKSNPCPEPQEKLNKLVEAADKADNNKLKDSIQSRNPRLFLGVGECMHVWVCCCTCVCVCVCVLLCLWVFGLLLCAAAAPPIASHWLQHHPLVHPSVPHRRHFVYDAIRGWREQKDERELPWQPLSGIKHIYTPIWQQLLLFGVPPLRRSNMHTPRFKDSYPLKRTTHADSIVVRPTA